MDGRLAGKTAIIVGAGQTQGDTIGNGRATAVLFGREGAQLLLVDRDAESLATTAEMLETDSGAKVETLVADITDEAQVAGITTRCDNAFGRIDILHNNVGIGSGDGPALHLDREVWDHIFDVNVTGMFLTCKHVIPLMRSTGGGSIVNISSIAAVASTPLAAYKASKAAVNALTHHLATANFKHGIRVNTIMPGLMDTPMAIAGQSEHRGIDADDLRARRAARVPLGQRQGTAWDVAYAALFLASDEAGFITGVALPVDGGQLAKIG